MTARPEPVEAYRLCDLPVGTKVKLHPDADVLTVIGKHATSTTLVEVVEWPQRVYDGIPADDLNAEWDDGTRLTSPVIVRRWADGTVPTDGDR